MYHQEKLDAFRDLLESTEDRVIVFYNFNEELTRLRKICEALDREVSFVNGSGCSMYAYECVENSVTCVACSYCISKGFFGFHPLNIFKQCCIT